MSSYIFQTKDFLQLMIESSETGEEANGDSNGVAKKKISTKELMGNVSLSNMKQT